MNTSTYQNSKRMMNLLPTTISWNREYQRKKNCID